MCQLLAGKPNRLKETMLAQEEAYMNKGSEARAAENFRGHPWGKKPDAMFLGLLVRLTDTWTLPEPERSNSTRPTVGGDAVPQERRRQVQSVSGGKEHLQGQTLLQSRHEVPTRHEIDPLSRTTRPGGSVPVAGCARTTVVTKSITGIHLTVARSEF